MHTRTHTSARAACQALEVRGQQQMLSPTALKTMYMTRPPAMASPVAARTHEDLGKLFRDHEDAKRRFEELNARGLSGA
jgi:hypothetical protein